MEPVVTPRTYSGRYEVTHLIARGGMAQVYRATDTRLGRPVALKVLFPELSVDRTFVERFRREAQAAANLSHPNVVAVYDWGGEDDGAYFIAMELVTGPSLAATLRTERALAATRAATIAAQVASALSYAHRNGVVHRDIKPGNVLLTDDAGHVKVTDFGIAQAVSTEEGLTMAGSVMGTAAYFSPEQAEGAVVDGRSDLYSLGVVLYEMLAGRPPFVGDSPVAVASMHVRNEPPLLRDLNPTVPEALERITMRALAKSPEDRYQTAEEMRADLQRFAEGRPVLAGAAVGAAVGATSVMGSPTTTSVLPQGGDTTSVTPAVVATAPPLVPPAPPSHVVEEHDEEEFAPQHRGAPPAAWLAIVLVLALLLVGFFAYRVLAGQNGLTVPNVVGETQAAAKATLKGLGLKVHGYQTRTSDRTRGIVLNVSPPVGHAISPGGGVELVVSAGPPKPVMIPKVTDLSLLNAESALTALGLHYRIGAPVQSSTTPVKVGTVLAQLPLQGSIGYAGTTYVTLTLLASNGTFPAPNLTDDTQTQAGVALGQYGLNPGTTNQACSNSVATGNVVSTNPKAGATVTAGDTLNLTISSGPCPVQVPYVVGLPISTAKSQVLAAHLQPVVGNCPQGSTSSGTVAKETPTQFTKVSPGSNVLLTPGCSGNPTGASGVSGVSGASGNTGVHPSVRAGHGHRRRGRRALGS